MTRLGMNRSEEIEIWLFEHIFLNYHNTLNLFSTATKGSVRAIKSMDSRVCAIRTMSVIFLQELLDLVIYHKGREKGGWTNLRPLKTEGQGLPSGSRPYGPISFGIPMGVGYKTGIDALWRLSIELSYTQTFTDYLDDVSGKYYDNADIEYHYGSTSAYFADPSSGAFPTWTHEGELRGDSKHKDGYIL